MLLGAGDFVFKLDRKKGATIGNLTCEKQKDAPDGWTEPYRFDKIEIGEGQTSLIVSRADVSMAPDVALTPSTSNEVLAHLAAHEHFADEISIDSTAVRAHRSAHGGKGGRRFRPSGARVAVRPRKSTR